MLFSNMTYFWFVAALIFLFFEMNTPGLFFFVSFAIGSLAASIVAFFEYSIVAQCLTALAVTIISFLLMRKFLKHKKLSEVLYASGETNIDALMGAVGVVLEDITPYKKGSVKIGGEVWRASSKEMITQGTIVSVLSIEGNTAIVETYVD